MAIFKECLKCNKLKREEDYYKGSGNTCKKCVGLRVKLYAKKNKEKVLKNKKDYYTANKEKFRVYNKTVHAPRRKNYQKELGRWVDSLKEKPCMDCGKTFEPFCMDFDHRDPSKKKLRVSKLVGLRYSKENILKEIEKCDLLCANCHRIRTCSKPPKSYNKQAKYVRRRQIIEEARSVPCTDCLLQFPNCCMEFDHREGEVKIADVSKIRSIEELQTEIKKCDVVCVVCHRKRTASRRNWRGHLYSEDKENKEIQGVANAS